MEVPRGSPQATRWMALWREARTCLPRRDLRHLTRTRPSVSREDPDHYGRHSAIGEVDRESRSVSGQLISPERARFRSIGSAEQHLDGLRPTAAEQRPGPRGRVQYQGGDVGAARPDADLDGQIKIGRML